MVNYYKVLGLNDDATELDIKNSFRKMAKIYHPDANSDSTSEKIFKEINEAYRVLSDSKLKREYDEKLNFNGNTIWGSFFANKFNRRGERTDYYSEFINKNYNQNQDVYPDEPIEYTYKQNIHIKLDITLDKSLNGLHTKLNYKFKSKCDSDLHDYTEIICNKCGGMGVSLMGICKQCKGRGQISIEMDCDVCKNKYYVLFDDDIEINIDKKIKKGDVFSYYGKGNDYDSMRGRLDVEIANIILPDGYIFDSDGDINSDIYINFFDALLGCDLNINDIHGGVIIHNFKPMEAFKVDYIIGENLGVYNGIDIKGDEIYTNHKFNVKIDYPEYYNFTEKHIKYLEKIKNDINKRDLNGI